MGWRQNRAMDVVKDPADPGASAVRVELASDQRAAGQARSAARQTLIGWRLSGLVDAVVLAASELVTNAVRHGRPPVSMELQRQSNRVRLDVHDGSPTEPPPSEGETLQGAESGRGLSIVHLLADEVAVEQVEDDGKIIHVTFGVDNPS